MPESTLQNTVSQQIETHIDRLAGACEAKWSYGVAEGAKRSRHLFWYHLGASRPQLSDHQQHALFRFLVTVRSRQQGQQLNLFNTLLFTLLRDSDLHVDSNVPLPLWHGLGLPPEAALLVEIPTSIPLPPSQPPPVTQAPELCTGSKSDLHGILQGANHTPLAGEYLFINGRRRAARTDHAGRFRIESVPADPHRPIHLRVRNHELTTYWGADTVTLRLEED